jgi:hypothetical protein
VQKEKLSSATKPAHAAAARARALAAAALTTTLAPENVLVAIIL